MFYYFSRFQEVLNVPKGESRKGRSTVEIGLMVDASCSDLQSLGGHITVGSWTALASSIIRIP